MSYFVAECQQNPSTTYQCFQPVLKGRDRSLEPIGLDLRSLVLHGQILTIAASLGPTLGEPGNQKNNIIIIVFGSAFVGDLLFSLKFSEIF
jgi:hypothetical protein